MPAFTVDTHLFRELGELLVGRDSTALVELLKNAYDADASYVKVEGTDLGSPSKGRIVITDDGNGMTSEIFTNGFLRIASRVKELGNRRSPRFKRRFTGAKGIGRLAAHKLAKNMRVQSAPLAEVFGDEEALVATIDWAQIESFETLDKVRDAITLKPISSPDFEGTKIELSNLNKRWTPEERSRVIREVATFLPPDVLKTVPDGITSSVLLFNTPKTRDILNEKEDPGFDVQLSGEFDVGEEYWTAVASAAHWILEVETDRKTRDVRYRLTPTVAGEAEYPGVEQHDFEMTDEKPGGTPSFQARILIREGHGGIKRMHRPWLVESAGVRVYMEGFRVLPYGEQGNDWLEIDSDYAQRQRKLRFLEDAEGISGNQQEDEDEGINALRNTSYFGAVFLTHRSSPDLEMLVNREGFIPNAAFLAIRRLIRVGIDLSVRARASLNRLDRDQRRTERRDRVVRESSETPERLKIREAAEQSAKHAADLARRARSAAAHGDHDKASTLIVSAAREVEKSTSLTAELVTDRAMMQVLAGVGLQMSAFTHELNGLLGMMLAVEQSVESLREQLQSDVASRRKLAQLLHDVGNVRRGIERQASYLTDVTSPDARRRRSRQVIAERFDASLKLLARTADKRDVTITNKIPNTLKTPPMFPAELTIIFSNLLSNAIKFAGRGGRVTARGEVNPEGKVTVRLDNTGKPVKLSEADKWFLPFKSTSVESDPILGQGMGMGLPIVRNLLEEYGATIRFVSPRPGFSTALSVQFP